MKHHGQMLMKVIKAKGFNIQSVADILPKTRVSVERDLKHETITRKVIIRYADKLGFSVDDFYSGKLEESGKEVTNPTDNEVISLQRQLIEEQRKRLDLQEHMLRFFPNAAQRLSATA